jgi:hypothetical protein
MYSAPKMTHVAPHCASDSGCTKMTHESRMLRRTQKRSSAIQVNSCSHSLIKLMRGFRGPMHHINKPCP